MATENESPAEENPPRFTGIKLGPPQKSAAGVPAVINSLKHIIGETGIFRGLKALSSMNQHTGFDCPGCAWPDPDDERSRLGEYCENGAKAIAEEATRNKLGAQFFKNYSIAELAHLSDFEIGKKGRIAEPMYLPEGGTHYQPISWDDAMKRIATHLNRLDSPDEAIFYTSGRTSNEAAFLYQLFVREFGTNNLPDCSNMCHESSGVALTEALGIGKGSVTLEDFDHAEVIIILGQNPGTNHPRMLTALQRAKKKGAGIISVNPLPEAGLLSFKNPQHLNGWISSGDNLTDIFLQVKINGDMALLQAISRRLVIASNINPGVIDEKFIFDNTCGYEDYKAHLLSLNENDLLELCGINSESLEKAITMLSGKSKIIACWAMGLTQHENAVDTIREIVNLLLLKGSIGKPGAGTCPVRGHSNVQGDRTMGIYEKPSESFLNALQKNFNFQPPRKDGYDVVDSIKAMHRGLAKVFIAMGGNFLSATPDTKFTAEALRKCRLTVQISTKLNRSHLVTGAEAIILPCLARSDRDVLNGELQFVTCENSMGVVQASSGNLKPVSENLRSEPEIVCLLALAVLGSGTKINWQNYLKGYDNIRTDIERTISGFDNYNQRVKQKGGFYLPNCNRDGLFATSNKKAHFKISFPEKINLKDSELMMMTIRSHDQFNTTIYGLDDRYRGIYNERRVILMNEADIDQLNLKALQVVDLVNYSHGVERRARNFIVIPYPIPSKCTATYFPETNVLVSINSVAKKSNTPISKLVIIEVHPASD